MNFQKLLNQYYDDMSEQDALNTKRMHGGVLWDFAAWLNRDAELRNEAVQRYGETPVSEQPTSEKDDEACPADHTYYEMLLSYQFCPYCGKRLHHIVISNES